MQLDSSNTIQESIWVGHQTGPQGGTGFRMLRAQFWTLAQSKCISKGVQKWTLLGSKVVPPGGSVFGPFILSDVLKLCRLPCAKNFNLEATLTQTASAAGILNCTQLFSGIRPLLQHFYADLFSSPDMQHWPGHVAWTLESFGSLSKSSVRCLQLFRTWISNLCPLRSMYPKPIWPGFSAANACATGSNFQIGGFIELNDSRFWFSERFNVAEVTALGLPMRLEAQKDIACYETLAQMALLHTFAFQYPHQRLRVTLPTIFQLKPESINFSPLASHCVSFWRKLANSVVL